MDNTSEPSELARWFEAQGLQDVTEAVKTGTETRAWFAARSGHRLFLKLYPPSVPASRVEVETSISGANLHPSIAPLRESLSCPHGLLLLYDRVDGDNLGSMEARAGFQALPLSERVAAVSAVLDAVTAISEAGFMIVDWYEGNMIYDFDRSRIWLFDWDLCRKGSGFTLEMDSNYGSSRLMAPEEFLRGSWLDQRTTVFNLGRYVLLTLPELAEALAPILARATYPARAERFASTKDFTAEFSRALPGPMDGLTPPPTVP